MKILIVSGGSGGHVIPARVLYEYFKEKNYSVSIAVDTRGSRYLKQQPTYQWTSYSSNTFVRYWNIFKIFFKTFSIVRKYDAIVSFGTYHAIPFLLSAILWRKKIHLHEQNTTLSRVNNMFHKWSTTLMVSWPNTYNNIPHIYVGMPIRPHKIPRGHGFKILICFGSQEAPLLNPILNKILALLPQEIQSKITILGSSNNFKKDKGLLVKYKSFVTGFDQLSVDGKAYDVMDLYATCSLAIGRGGAGFLYEMMALKKPFITIPIHCSVENHQKYNSEYAVKMASGLLLWDQNQIPAAVEFITAVFNKTLTFQGEVPSNSCQLIEDIIINRPR
jgi:UDP-N-acetylglucosamine--N-acetylmuramyl-(pentapeptide) pyrophosphoryl-undecaprenol N-acetylglucosamine transferase